MLLLFFLGGKPYILFLAPFKCPPGHLLTLGVPSRPARVPSWRALLACPSLSFRKGCHDASCELVKLFFFSTFRVNVCHHFGCRTKSNVDVLSDMVSHSHISCTDVMVARRDFITLHKSYAIFSVDVESDSTLWPAHCFK